MQSRRCSACSGQTRRIRIIDRGEDSRHHDLEYSEPNAARGIWNGQYPAAGTVAAYMCEACDQITLFGESGDATVNLEGPETTDRDLEALPSKSQIVELHLCGANITDAGLKHLAGNARLRVLDISLTDITDDGVESLLQMPNLTTLRIGSTKITDAGLQRLTVLSILEDVNALNTSITPTGVQRLQLALPNCNVDT